MTTGRDKRGRSRVLATVVVGSLAVANSNTHGAGQGSLKSEGDRGSGQVRSLDPRDPAAQLSPEHLGARPLPLLRRRWRHVVRAKKHRGATTTPRLPRRTRRTLKVKSRFRSNR